MSTQEAFEGPQDQETRAVEREIEIDAPLAAVWKALTDADELTRWFPLNAGVTPGVGGSVWMSWTEVLSVSSSMFESPRVQNSAAWLGAKMFVLSAVKPRDIASYASSVMSCQVRSAGASI